MYPNGITITHRGFYDAFAFTMSANIDGFSGISNFELSEADIIRWKQALQHFQFHLDSPQTLDNPVYEETYSVKLIFSLNHKRGSVRLQCDLQENTDTGASNYLRISQLIELWQVQLLIEFFDKIHFTKETGVINIPPVGYNAQC